MCICVLTFEPGNSTMSTCHGNTQNSHLARSCVSASETRTLGQAPGLSAVVTIHTNSSHACTTHTHIHTHVRRPYPWTTMPRQNFVQLELPLRFLRLVCGSTQSLQKHGRMLEYTGLLGVLYACVCMFMYEGICIRDSWALLPWVFRRFHTFVHVHTHVCTHIHRWTDYACHHDHTKPIRPYETHTWSATTKNRAYSSCLKSSLASARLAPP